MIKKFNLKHFIGELQGAQLNIDAFFRAFKGPQDYSLTKGCSQNV